MSKKIINLTQKFKIVTLTLGQQQQPDNVKECERTLK